ncbi:Ig-like domain-containing protein [Agromyces mangrovi Wang et al. 2018]|uniref:Ig-like domain-containing protein n=1 Tax=Agromyces mangrovi TaxID=1858653 RepID=UPI0025741842|nr:Ig-like domain-containing protein [Agromyces mangrovi]
MQVPPVAVDDEFGARPLRTTILPVLLNDYDANGDVLSIASVGAVPDDVEVDLVSNDQQLQVTLPGDAAGTIALDYTIDDGRGGSASAVVRITVRGDDENAPPVQARGASAVVEAGGRVATDVLADWYDPDGDPFYLSGASTAEPDAATFTPGGEVVFTERGGRGPVRTVGLSVSDGRAIGAGTLTVAVRAPGSVPLVAEPFAVLAAAGRSAPSRRSSTYAAAAARRGSRPCPRSPTWSWCRTSIAAPSGSRATRWARTTSSTRWPTATRPRSAWSGSTSRRRPTRTPPP